ncbi:GNAT family N-acetyltransferase [Saccharibacillus alkalitolerans]|uniref:GNAT family N-acetyltransferase n=1 Tax=Saccharibacillus alkalitolerans TaxID=2705290 RepID=UPI00197F13AA|nr:GNAT family N-acetyltransferase [Saccharibacillus alkalitolerans]
MKVIVSIRVLPAQAEHFRTYLPGIEDPLPPGALRLDAEIDGIFAGTALFIEHPRSRTGSISVLHTLEPFRRMGVGSLLLQEAERQMLEAGCGSSRITLTLRSGKPAEGLCFFRGHGYDRETLVHRSYTLRSDSVRKDPLLTRLRLPDGAELKSLLSASAQERAELAAAAAELPPDLNLFQEERLLHAEFSTFLKIEGRIAGWIGVQKLTSNLLLLRCMYVRPDLGIRVNGMALFAEMNRRHRLLERFAHHMLTVSGENGAMLRLADRKLAPHASSVKTIMRLEKRL